MARVISEPAQRLLAVGAPLLGLFPCTEYTSLLSPFDLCSSPCPCTCQQQRLAVLLHTWVVVWRQWVVRVVGGWSPALSESDGYNCELPQDADLARFYNPENTRSADSVQMRPGSIAGGFLLSTVEVSLYSSILVHPTVTYGLALCLVLVHRTRLFSLAIAHLPRFNCPLVIARPNDTCHVRSLWTTSLVGFRRRTPDYYAHLGLPRRLSTTRRARPLFFRGGRTLTPSDPIPDVPVFGRSLRRPYPLASIEPIAWVTPLSPAPHWRCAENYLLSASNQPLNPLHHQYHNPRWQDTPPISRLHQPHVRWQR